MELKEYIKTTKSTEGSDDLFFEGEGEEEEEEQESGCCTFKHPKEVYIVLTMACIANIAYFQLGTLYPEFLKKRQIDDTNLGFLMSTWAICLIISSIVTGNLLLKVLERITCVYLGAVFVVSNILF